MESIPLYHSLRGYWRRRGYRRLNRTAQKGLRIVRFGGKTRRAWRLRRAIPKPRLRVFSPARILTRLRDAYIDAMLGMAGKSFGLQSSGPTTFGGKRIPEQRPEAVEKRKGFEDKLLFQMCRSIAASREVPAA